MFDFEKIAQDAYVDELEKIALSQKTMKSAAKKAFEESISLLGKRPVTASNINLATKKVDQHFSINRGALIRSLKKIKK